MAKLDWRTPLAAAAALVVGFALLPALADARPQDGIKEGAGHHVEMPRTGGGWYGAYTLGDVTAYCVDLASGPPGEATAWTEYTNYTLHKQQGWGTGRGEQGNSVSRTSVTDLAQLSWILHETGPSPSPDVAAAVEHSVRLRTVEGPAQLHREAERWAAVTRAHPGAGVRFAELDRGAKDFAGPYALEVEWSRRPTSADPTGELRVTVRSASGKPLPDRPVSWGAAGELELESWSATTGETGLATARVRLATPFDEAVTGSLAVRVEEVPALLPRLFVPSQSTIQRMVAAGEPTALGWRDSVELQPIPWTPEVTTRTRDVVAESGRPAVDIITLTGGKPGARFSGSTTLYGPFESLEALADAAPETAPEVGTAEFGGTFDDEGAAEVHSTSLVFGTPGYYMWVEHLDDAPLVVAPPAPTWPQESETSIVIAPALTSELVTSGDPVPGVSVADSLVLGGVPAGRKVPGAGTQLSVRVSGQLLGPIPPSGAGGQSCEDVNWDAAPVLAGYEGVEMAADRLEGLLPSILAEPGCYTATAQVVVAHEGAPVAGFSHGAGEVSQTVLVAPPSQPPPPITSEPAQSKAPQPEPTPTAPTQPGPTPVTPSEPPTQTTPRINSGAPISEARWGLVAAGTWLTALTMALGRLRRGRRP